MSENVNGDNWDGDFFLSFFSLKNYEFILLYFIFYLLRRNGGCFAFQRRLFCTMEEVLLLEKRGCFADKRRFLFQNHWKQPLFTRKEPPFMGSGDKIEQQGRGATSRRTAIRRKEGQMQSDGSATRSFTAREEPKNERKVEGREYSQNYRVNYLWQEDFQTDSPVSEKKDGFLPLCGNCRVKNLCYRYSVDSSRCSGIYRVKNLGYNAAVQNSFGCWEKGSAAKKYRVKYLRLAFVFDFGKFWKLSR